MVKINRSEYQRKIKYVKHGKHTRWAPFWTVIKKYGKGKRIHPSFMTRYKRSWRRTKLHIRPVTMRKRQFRD